MVNVVIDFNNIAMRAMNACVYMRDSGVSNYDTDIECGILARKITMDMAYILRVFAPNRVIIVCDAKHPWREGIYDDIPGMTYKGNRPKDETKNWTNIFNTINDLKEIYRKKGCIVTEIENTEADDLAALYKQKLFTEMKECVVLVSSDRDWCQLVDFQVENGTHRYCVVYNPIANNKGKKKFYLTRDCMTWYDTPEVANIFFSNYDNGKEILKNSVKKDSKIELEPIDPVQVVFEKIVCGDDGDNVPGFYDFFNNGKKVRFTELRMTKLLESASISNYDEFKVACVNGSIKGHISKLFKHEINDMEPNERLMRQRKLVELNPTLFPEKTIRKFNDSVKNIDSCGRVENIGNIKMEDLLRGTDYVSDDYVPKPRENAIFSDLSDLNKLVKPLF